ncbi:hypothetical protein D3H34_06095 [Acidovorax cavernicola]|uniref:Uncharacterized protein n=1 Tax=Acidovorax cavernicola TaxID=1675792 RepID=A0A9X8GWP5_9BURK|nr:hypothetical protein D3H34_06095 [Acidovorax cavernicola]
MGAAGAITGVWVLKFAFVGVTGAVDALVTASGNARAVADLSACASAGTTAVVKAAARAALSCTKSFKVT